MFDGHGIFSLPRPLPGRTTQTLAIGTDKLGSMISITDYDKISGMSKSKEKKLTIGFEQ